MRRTYLTGKQKSLDRVASHILVTRGGYRGLAACENAEREALKDRRRVASARTKKHQRRKAKKLAAAVSSYGDRLAQAVGDRREIDLGHSSPPHGGTNLHTAPCEARSMWNVAGGIKRHSLI